MYIQHVRIDGDEIKAFSDSISSLIIEVTSNYIILMGDFIAKIGARKYRELRVEEFRIEKKETRTLFLEGHKITIMNKYLKIDRDVNGLGKA